MPKITDITQLFDEQGEIMAWIILVLSVVGWALGLGDWPAVALVTLSCLLMGLIRRFKAGPAGLEVDRASKSD